MQASNTIDPVALLKAIEDRCRSCSAGLPHKVEVSGEWSGIAFRVGSNNLVTPLGEVIEILDYPDLARVPRTHSWVRGIANVRGNLLPVIDLHGYLGGSMAQRTDKTRILVIDSNGVYSGVVVDEVLGLKHFMEEEITEDDLGIDIYLQPYTRHGYRRDGKTWGLFSFNALVEAPEFFQVAV